MVSYFATLTMIACSIIASTLANPIFFDKFGDKKKPSDSSSNANTGYAAPSAGYGVPVAPVYRVPVVVPSRPSYVVPSRPIYSVPIRPSYATGGGTNTGGDDNKKDKKPDFGLGGIIDGIKRFKSGKISAIFGLKKGILSVIKGKFGGGDSNSADTSSSTSYGAPAPSPSYGAPAPSPSYGAPAPSPSYGAPSPSPSYGAPSPSPSYGAPAPSPSYGAPAPSPSYGAPTSAPTYSAPAPAPASGYGAPAAPAISYGAPSTSYTSN